MYAFNYVNNNLWAIKEDYLKTILDISLRVHEKDMEAILAKQEKYSSVAMLRGERLPNSNNAYIRGNVGILPIIGVISRYSNIFSNFSGGTSVSALANDLSELLNSPKVKSILLEVDSPGGEANGIHELANIIKAVNKEKTVTAYVSGMAASGAYWLSSAANSIVADKTAMLGSIGVVSSQRDYSERDEKQGIKTYQIVSSQSPNKRPDLNTEEGRNTVQTLVDNLADVFISDVATNRNVSKEEVISDFGQGGILIASKAVKNKMADSLGSFEETIQSLQKGKNNMNKTELKAKIFEALGIGENEEIEVEDDSMIKLKEENLELRSENFATLLLSSNKITVSEKEPVKALFKVCANVGEGAIKCLNEVFNSRTPHTLNKEEIETVDQKDLVVLSNNIVGETDGDNKLAIQKRLNKFKLNQEGN